MSALTIRKLDPRVKAKLRVRAARHGCSMEEEVREILRDAVDVEEQTASDLVGAIRRRVEPFGGVDLELPAREPMRAPPRFR